MEKHYRHLSVEERSLIQLSLEAGKSLSAIGWSLDRATSTISRELSRNGWSNPSRGARQRGRPMIAGGYRSRAAQQRAAAGATKARKPKRLIEGSELRQCVERLVRDFHSPAQIAGILKRMNPADKARQVSHETIYRAIYAMPRGSLRTDLIACLRQSRKSRRPRARGEDCRGTIPNGTKLSLVCTIFTPVLDFLHFMSWSS